MMLTRTYILLLMGLLLTLPARAQSGRTAPDTPPFHTAAQQYLAGHFPRALATVDAGLRADPGNPRLLALRAKIERERPPSSQDGSNQDDAASQPPSEEDASSQQQNRTEQQEQDAGSSEQEDPSAGQEEHDEDASGDPAQHAPSTGGAAEAPPPEEAAGDRDFSEGTSLSPAEAARILRALENQEKQLLRQVQKRPSRSRHVEKDW